MYSTVLVNTTLYLLTLYFVSNIYANFHYANLRNSKNFLLAMWFVQWILNILTQLLQMSNVLICINKLNCRCSATVQLHYTVLNIKYILQLVIGSGTRKPETQKEHPTFLVPDPNPRNGTWLFWYPTRTPEKWYPNPTFATRTHRYFSRIVVCNIVIVSKHEKQRPIHCTMSNFRTTMSNKSPSYNCH